jgi:hypothetical protein
MTTTQLHPKRNKASWFAALTLLVALAAALLALRPAQTQAAPPSDQTRGCSDFTPAAAARESHETYDPNSGDLRVTTVDGAYVLNENSQACRANPVTTRRLEQNRAVLEANTVGMCADARQAVAEDRKTEKGRGVNLDAARQFIAEKCN